MTKRELFKKKELKKKDYAITENAAKVVKTGGFLVTLLPAGIAIVKKIVKSFKKS